jgi:hypothetical protein
VPELAAVMPDDSARQCAEQKPIRRSAAGAIVAIIVIRISIPITAVITIGGHIAVDGRETVRAVIVATIPSGVMTPGAHMTIRIAMTHTNAHVNRRAAMVASVAMTL